MLLSGTLEHGELLSKRAGLVDEKIGNGHLVMFAFRPYWRWQTQGTFAMGFNALMNSSSASTRSTGSIRRLPARKRVPFSLHVAWWATFNARAVAWDRGETPARDGSCVGLGSDRAGSSVGRFVADTSQPGQQSR